MKSFVLLFSLACAVSSFAANIVLIGDSTLAPRTDKVKLGSWGDALKASMQDGNGIVNCAVGGRTVRTTLPKWKEYLGKIQKDDYVIIQFGINDASPRKLVEEAEFKKTLVQFVDDVAAKGATPILCGPVSNGGYSKKAKPDAKFVQTKSRRTYADYTKQVADEKKLAFVDMTALTGAELEKRGKDEALALFTGDTTKKDDKGVEKPIFDTCHPNKAGAKRFAELFIADVKSRKLPVASLFK